MKQVFLILMLLVMSVMCQSYTNATWQIDVTVPQNLVIDRWDIYIERTPNTIQMYLDMPITELQALNPVLVSQSTIPPATTVTVQQTYPNNGIWMRAGAVGYDGTTQVTGLGVSDIIWVPAEYQHIIPSVNIIRLP